MGLQHTSKKETISGYRQTHLNHPSAVWVRHSEENYTWLYRHAKELLNEARRRFGSEKVHASEEIIHFCFINRDKILFTSSGFTEIPKCVPDVYKSVKIDVVATYRMYYKFQKILHDGKDFYIKDGKTRIQWEPIWARIYPEEKDYFEQYHKVESMKLVNIQDPAEINALYIYKLLLERRWKRTGL